MNPQRGHDPLLVVGAAALAVVGWVWAGAQAAAALTGHGRLATGVSGAVTASVKFPARFGNPATAWPSPVRDQLPAPPIYWGATIAVGVVLVALVGFVWTRWTVRPGPERRRRLGVETESRLATRRDLAPLVVPRPVRGRLILGRAAGRLVATEDRRGAPARTRGARRRQGDRSAVAVIGPARCGKTANLISGILEWDGPAVLSSVKSDLLGATVARRSQVGEVRVFDPTSSTGYRSAGWSPLRAAATLTGAQKAARALVEAGPRTGAENLDFFSAMAEQLLWPLLHAAAIGGRPMGDVLRWIQSQDRPLSGGPSEVSSILDGVLVAGDGDQRAAAAAAMAALEATSLLDERTRGGAYATARTLLRAWEDPAVAASSAHQDIDLAWLLQGSNTLYICAPAHEQARLAPVFGGMLGDLLQQAYEQVNRTNAQLSNLLLVMDEAGNTPTAWLPAVASTCAGIGVLLVTVWQSVAQIRASYGPLADSVLTNHGTKLIFSGISDAATMEYASRLLGHEEVLQHAMSADVFAARRSVNDSTARRELVPADVLRLVAPFQALLVHGTLRPAHLNARPFYQDRRLRRLSTGHRSGLALTRRS